MDYKNDKIYQLLNKVNDEVYVGSTIQPLSKRMNEHRSTCNKSDKKVNVKLYQLMREIGQENFYIELIESYPCNSKEELKAKEGYYIRERATLNMLIAGRNHKGWVDDNKEHVQTYLKEYNDSNKERLDQYRKQYRQENQEHMN